MIVLFHRCQRKMASLKQFARNALRNSMIFIISDNYHARLSQLLVKYASRKITNPIQTVQFPKFRRLPKTKVWRILKNFFGQCFKVIGLKFDLLSCSLPTIMTFQKIFFNIFILMCQFFQFVFVLHFAWINELGIHYTFLSACFFWLWILSLLTRWLCNFPLWL